MRNLLLISILLLLTISGLFGQSSYDREMETLARLLNTAVNVSGKERIAVLDFTDIDGRGNTLGAHVAEDLRYWLLQTGRRYTVLERSALDRVIEEQRLSAQAIIDESSAVELGRLLATDAIIFGSVVVDGRKATVTAKVIDVETGALLSMERAQVKVSKAVSKEYDQADNWMKRKPQSPKMARETPPYQPVSISPTFGVYGFYNRSLLTAGVNLTIHRPGSAQMINGKRREVPANRSIVFSANYLHNVTDYNAPFMLGFREAIGGISDNRAMAVFENGETLSGGDVWLLGDNPPDFGDYLLEASIESARIAHVQLKDIRVSHFYFDLWYKLYLTPDYYYRDAFRFYAGVGFGLDLMLINATYEGKEAFYRSDGDLTNPSFTVQETAFREEAFPF